MNLQKIAMGTLVVFAAQDQIFVKFSPPAVAQTQQTINNKENSTNIQSVETITVSNVENEISPVFAGKSMGVNLNNQVQPTEKQINVLQAETLVSWEDGVPVITPSNLSDELKEIEEVGESGFHDDREPKSIKFSENNPSQLFEDNSVNLFASISVETAPFQESDKTPYGKVSSRLDALRNQIDLYQQDVEELPPLGSPDIYLPDAPPASGFIWPARGVLTSGYGMRWGRMHRGIDIAAPIGTPIFAAAAGVVTYAGWNKGGYGNLVEIRHPDGSITRYAHNNRILVRKGQKVDQSQQIAEMGSTGFSTGPHCHFEIHSPGRGAVDPIAFLPRESINNRRISLGW